MPRPVEFYQSIADNICEKLASGKSLSWICEDASMPSRKTVYQWLQNIEEFRNDYAQAREDQADTFVDEIIDIADDTALDANQARLRIDARKWVAGKMKPKKYGEKIDHAVSGAVTVNITSEDATVL